MKPIFLSRRLNNNGFTLIELIVVMAIIAILATIAIPSLRGFTDSSNVTSVVNNLVSACNVARSEAVTRGLNVTVCKSNDQATCSGNWVDGWIVFSDINGNGAVNTLDGDEILRVYDGPNGNTTMTASGNIVNRLTYASNGFANGFSGRIEVELGNKKIDIVTNIMGRVRTE